ncbi:unnamed protein product, partial [Ixodes pacificus]
GISEASGERRHLSNKYDVQNSPERIPRTSNIRKHVTRSLCYSRFSARLHHAPQRDVIWGNTDICHVPLEIHCKNKLHRRALSICQHAALAVPDQINFRWKNDDRQFSDNYFE